MAVREFSGQLDGVKEFDGLLDSELPPGQAAFGVYRAPKQKPAERVSPKSDIGVMGLAKPEPGAPPSPATQAVVDRWQERLTRPVEAGTIGPIQGPEASTGSVVSGLINALYSSAQKTRAGMRASVADIVGSPDAAATARREVADAQLREAATTPAFESPTAAGIYGGVASTLQQIPAVAAGLATRSPAVATAAMVAPLVPQQYGVYRGAGADPMTAGLGAAGYAGAEYLTERLPMGVIVSKLGKVGALKLVTDWMVKDGLGEQAATLAQDAIDKAIAEPDKTWGDYLRERPDAAYQTLIATLTQGGIMGGVNSGVRAVQRAEDRAVAEDARQTALIKAAEFFKAPAGVARELPADVPLDGEAPAASAPDAVPLAQAPAAVVAEPAPATPPAVPSPLEQAAPAVADIVTPQTAPNQPADVVAEPIEQEVRAVQGMQQRPVSDWTEADYIGRPETAPVVAAVPEQPGARQQVPVGAPDPVPTPQPVPQQTATQNLQAAQVAAAAQDQQAVNQPAMLSDKAMQLTQPTEGLRPGDVVATTGRPFATQAQAKAEAKNAGPGWRVARGGGGFVVRFQPASEKQVANAKRLAQNQSSVDAERDSMFAAIAKLGGISRDEVVSKWGVDPAELKGLFGAGIKRVATGGGMSIDAMGEALAEHGYLSRDEHGKHDTRELEELFDSELRGEKHYTPQGWEQALRERQAAEYEEYLNQQDLEAAGASNFTDEQMDALDAILGSPAEDEAVSAFLHSISEADNAQSPTAEEDVASAAAAEAAADQPGARETVARDEEGSDGVGAEVDREAQAADGAGERAADFALRSETVDEARARTKREEQQRADEARQRREDDRRAQADAGRDDFVLTGSDRDADQAAARGQEALFSRSAMKSVDANIRRGTAAMHQAIAEQRDVHRAMFRNDLGWIDFVYGDAKRGLAHIIRGRMAKDGMSAADVKRMLTDEVVEAIARGETIGQREAGKSKSVKVRYGKHVAVLIRREGGNGWLMTGYEAYPDQGKGVNPGATPAGNEAQRPTRDDPTLARINAGAGFVASDSSRPAETGAADTQRDTSKSGSPPGADDSSIVAPNPDSGMSRGSGRGISAEAVREAIAADTYGHDVDVYESLDQAPSYVRDQAEREGADGVEGFWDSRANRVALIASNLESPERAVEVARHELIGHYGLQNMVGVAEMVRLERRVIAAEREGNRAILQAAAQVDRTQPGLTADRRAREIIAVMAESGVHNSIVRRVLDAIRQFLRRVGFAKGDITDAEISQLLRETQDYLRNKGLARSEETGTAFSARDRTDYSQDELNFGPRQSFEVPDPGLWDNIVRALQDNKIDLKRVQDAIRGAGNTIRERADTYLNEELYHGRVSAQVDDLVERRVAPLLKAVHESGLTLSEVNRYLYARHAPERNEQLAKVNPHRRHNQALSGMSNAEAAGILGAFRNEGKTEKLERVAAMVDAITKESRRRIVSSGLEQREVVDAWESAYKNYVPLMQDMPNHGRRKVGGFDVRGAESQRSLGQSDSNIAKAAIQQDIVANVIAQAQTTIQRAEKAKVARSLLDLAREFPHDGFWRVDQPPKKRRINPDTGLVELADDPNFKAKDNVLTVKENGVEHFIVFNERNERAMRLAEAMQSMDAPQLPWAIEAFGKVTRYLSQWITARNPLFWITNFARDVQGAAFNLQNTPIAGQEAKVLTSIPKAMAGYWKIVRGDGGGQWAEYARQFKEDGSETGYVKPFESPADRMADLEKQVEDMKQGAADPRRLARSLVEMIDDYNNIVENGVRLAVYQTGRDAGLTNRQAASLAKNITVNFNRRGSQTVFANSLYMFFNANLQGNARFLGALAKNRRAQAVAGGLVAMGFVMDAVNRAVGGDDDETGKKKYDEIPDFEKERNWIFMTPSGKYVKVPLPIGPHVMVNAGRLMSEMIFKKGGGVLDKGASMTRVALDAFNPMGSPGSLSQFLLPSVVKPLAQAAENKSFNGGPVYREGDDRSYTGPAYDRAFRSTGDQWKAASKLLNDVTGGDSVKPGAIDVPPEVLRLMFTSYLFPGITQTADKAVTTASDTSKGKKVEASQIPALSRFYGEAPEERAQERAFYEETKKLKQTVGQAKRYAKDGNREGMVRVLTDLGDGDLAAGKKRMGEFDAAEKALLNLNKARKRIETDNKPDAEQREMLNELEDRRMKVMRRILSGQK